MIGLVLAALFIVLNGFFVAAEFALVKVRATQLHTRAEKGEKTAIAAEKIVRRLDRYLSVTQLGITIASLGLGWIGEPAIEHLVARGAEAVLGAPPDRVVQVSIVVLAFGVLTFSHVLFGELVPKLVAIQRSEQVALSVALPLRVVDLAFRPLLWILEIASRVVLRAMGMQSASIGEGTLSEEEIIGILAANAARSPSGQAKSELLQRVFRFAQRAARHSMVPRVDVVSLPIETTGALAIEKLRTLQYSRVLLTKERSVDEVAGYLYAKDFLLDPGAASLPNLWSLRRDALFVPETQGLVDVLREMQRAQTPIAVVVDEYGGTSGIVTMEDLLEEIVGEIRDEFDEEPAHVVKLQEQGLFEVNARARMDELRPIGVTVTEEEASEPVGAVVLERLGRLPRVGDSVKLGEHVTCEVTAVARRRVTRLRVRVPQVSETAGT